MSTMSCLDIHMTIFNMIGSELPKKKFQSNYSSCIPHQLQYRSRTIVNGLMQDSNSPCNVDVPYMVLHQNQTFAIEWYGGMCGYKNKYKNQKHVSKKGWTTNSNYDNHSTLDSHHNWKNLYDQLISTKYFTLIMNKMFTCAPKIMRNLAITLIEFIEISLHCLRVSQPRSIRLVTILDPSTSLQYIFQQN